MSVLPHASRSRTRPPRFTYSTDSSIPILAKSTPNTQGVSRFSSISVSQEVLMSCAEKKPHPPSGGHCPRTFDKYLGSFSPHTRFLCSAHSEEVRESIILWFISGSSGYTTSPV